MIKKIELKNGIKILTEQMPSAYSAVIMLWVNIGAEFENSKNNGISHFIEHMLFKGTKNRSAKEIVQVIESTGGGINAFTQKESTCFYSKVLTEHVPLAVDTLLDMIINSNLLEKDLEIEKQIIIDEIKMYEDTPDELVYDLLLKSFFNNHPLGMPIAGTIESVSSISKNDIIEFMNKYYVPSNIVISIAGNFDENIVIDQITSLMEKKKDITLNKISENCVITPELNTVNKEIEQSHFCIGVKGVSMYDPERYTLSIIDVCLGGGMSSRLFQKIREDKGLAYCIETFEESYRYFGIFGVYAASNPKNVKEIINIVIDEFNSIKSIGFTDDEIKKAKNQIKGNLLISLDCPKGRASRNARSELYFNKIVSVDEICFEIEKVTNESIKNLANRIFDTANLGITIVGPKAHLTKEFYQNKTEKAAL